MMTITDKGFFIGAWVIGVLIIAGIIHCVFEAFKDDDPPKGS